MLPLVQRREWQRDIVGSLAVIIINDYYFLFVGRWWQIVVYGDGGHLRPWS